MVLYTFIFSFWRGGEREGRDNWNHFAYTNLSNDTLFLHSSVVFHSPSPVYSSLLLMMVVNYFTVRRDRFVIESSLE